MTAISAFRRLPEGTLSGRLAFKGTQLTDVAFSNDASLWKPASEQGFTPNVRDFMSIDEVFHDLRLTVAEKREVFASWASDSRGVPDAPTLRQLGRGTVVRVDEILQALKSLDPIEDGKPILSSLSRPVEGRLPTFRSKLKTLTRRSWSSDDDDDDPPPCPVTVRGPVTGPLSGGDASDPVLALAA